MDVPNTNKIEYVWKVYEFDRDRKCTGAAVVWLAIRSSGRGVDLADLFKGGVKLISVGGWKAFFV